ncbi:MAG: DUF2267 domain-containing protein, partial [Geminicoccaceae bacterium]
IHQTNTWLKSLFEPLHTEDRHKAYLALRVTLHALRDRLPPELAVHLAAQLPMLVRGFFYEDWQMAKTPSTSRHVDDFLAPIERAFRNDRDADVEAIARAIFALLTRELDHGEIRKVVSALPRDLKGLWPEEARS